MACQGKDLRKSHQVSWSSGKSCRAQRTGSQRSAEQVLEGPALPSSSRFKLLWKKPRNSGVNNSYYLLGACVLGHLIRLFFCKCLSAWIYLFLVNLHFVAEKTKAQRSWCGRNRALLIISNISQIQSTLFKEWECTPLLSFKNLLENFHRKFS